MKTLKISITGDGNCMFYAYGVSLMYFLRSQTECERFSSEIFELLALTPAQRVRLTTLLNKPGNKCFSYEQLAEIERNLGDSLRRFTAQQVIVAYENSPRDTQIYTSANFAIRVFLKRALETMETDEATLAASAVYLSHEENEAINIEDFTEDDLFRVEKIANRLKSYPERHAARLLEKFLSKIKENQTEKEQKALMDSLVDELTLRFFKHGNGKYLKLYQEWLAGNGEWGSEANLYVLNRALQGERRVEIAPDKFDWRYERPMELQVYQGPRPAFLPNTPAEMILNNSMGIHWDSRIPYYILLKGLYRDVCLTKDREKSQSKETYLNSLETSMKPAIERLSQLQEIIFRLKIWKPFDDQGVRATSELADKLTGVAEQLTEAMYLEYERDWKRGSFETTRINLDEFNKFYDFTASIEQTLQRSLEEALSLSEEGSALSAEQRLKQRIDELMTQSNQFPLLVRWSDLLSSPQKMCSKMPKRLKQKESSLQEEDDSLSDLLFLLQNSNISHKEKDFLEGLIMTVSQLSVSSPLRENLRLRGEDFASKERTMQRLAVGVAAIGGLALAVGIIGGISTGGLGSPIFLPIALAGISLCALGMVSYFAATPLFYSQTVFGQELARFFTAPAHTTTFCDSPYASDNSECDKLVEGEGDQQAQTTLDPQLEFRRSRSASF